MAKSVFDSLQIYFRANVPVVAVDAPSADEELTLTRILVEVAKPMNMPVITYDDACGFRSLSLHPEAGLVYSPSSIKTTGTLVDVVEKIVTNEQRCIFVLIDVHNYLTGNHAYPDSIRAIKSLATQLLRTPRRVVLLGQNIVLPSDYSGVINTIHIPLPNYAELDNIIQTTIKNLQTAFSVKNAELRVSPVLFENESLLRTCQGLSANEIEIQLRRSAIENQEATVSVLNERTIKNIHEYKISKLRKLGVEFAAAPDIAVGGMNALKSWLKVRSHLFSKEAQKHNLPFPKGMLLVGPPGTGKSLVVKTIAQYWSMPVLSVNIGSLMGSFVGDSERNMRELLKMADAVAPCILAIDELEKAFAGTSGDSTDSGTTQRVFGQFLSWMNDHTTPVFVAATANSVQQLPMEFRRKGRFDEIWYVDLPNDEERYEILSNHCRNYVSNVTKEWLQPAIAQTAGYSGAEIAYAVRDAAIEAYSESKNSAEFTQEQLLQSLNKTVPLSKGQHAQLRTLREWAQDNARWANDRLNSEIKAANNILLS